MFEPDGKFGFCLADYALADGRKLTFAMSPTDEINLGVMVPKAGFVLGGHYDLSLTLTQAKAQGADTKDFMRSVRAVAIDENSLLLQMGNNPPFTKALTNSRDLSVTANGKTMLFALPAMPPVLDALKACNKESRQKTNRVAANIEKAMPETLKALLVAAGLKDIAPLRMDDIPIDQRPADFIWKTGNVIGGVRERLAPKDKSLTELVGLHIQGLKKKCTVAFKTEVNREEEAPGLKLRTAEADCRMKGLNGEKDKDMTAVILFYLTAAGRFTEFTHEGSAADKAEAISVRDALKRTIVQLAEETGKKFP